MKNLLFSEFIELDVHKRTYKKIEGNVYSIFRDINTVRNILEYPSPFKIHILFINYESKEKTSIVLLTDYQYQCYLKELKNSLPTSDLVVDSFVSNEEWLLIEDYFGKTSQLSDLFCLLDSQLLLLPLSP